MLENENKVVDELDLQPPVTYEDYVDLTSVVALKCRFALMLRHVEFAVLLFFFLIVFLDQRDVNQQISATCWHRIQVTRNEEPLGTTASSPRHLFYVLLKLPSLFAGILVIECHTSYSNCIQKCIEKLRISSQKLDFASPSMSAQDSRMFSHVIHYEVLLSECLLSLLLST